MNIADSEVVVSIMEQNGYAVTNEIEAADVILINTCSVRDNAEQRIRKRLVNLNALKRDKPGLLIGIIGCMAERLKEQLVKEERSVDLVIGPDAYRDLPGLISMARSGQKAINVLLSRQEVYGDILPSYQDPNRISAFVTIMRGCNNFCSYCVVPYTRGVERSKDSRLILSEIYRLSQLGFKEIILIGQNVDSYRWSSDEGTEINFANLLAMVAKAVPNIRIRFSTSHPKDMSDSVLFTMSRYPNICKHIHLPVQSGSTRILRLMNRGYTREWYKGRISAIRKILPECSISTDIISGFCSETEEEHQETLSLMEWGGFDFSYMFKYSERPDTKAADKLKDDIPEEIKNRRLNEVIQLQNNLSARSKEKDLDQVFEVLVEGTSKKSDDDLFGRTSQNKVVVFPKSIYQIGDLVQVKIKSCTSATLIGEAL
jgi:tRNA-2-methylthio-N6-dimethylallyladenosine synthase